MKSIATTTPDPDVASCPKAITSASQQRKNATPTNPAEKHNTPRLRNPNSYPGEKKQETRQEKNKKKKHLSGLLPFDALRKVFNLQQWKLPRNTNYHQFITKRTATNYQLPRINNKNNCHDLPTTTNSQPKQHTTKKKKKTDGWHRLNYQATSHAVLASHSPKAQRPSRRPKASLGEVPAQLADGPGILWVVVRFQESEIGPPQNGVRVSIQQPPKTRGNLKQTRSHSVCGLMNRSGKHGVTTRETTQKRLDFHHWDNPWS